jgi:hypothetical protein
MEGSQRRAAIVENPTEMPRFVILEHDHPHLHWDLMLESGPALLTWRLATPPRPGEVVNAVRVFDHRLLYLDYEGPISGGRGRVIRWAHGTFVWKVQADDRMAVSLQSEQLRGELRLEKVENDIWFSEFLADQADD